MPGIYTPKILEFGFVGTGWQAKILSICIYNLILCSFCCVECMCVKFPKFCLFNLCFEVDKKREKWKTTDWLSISLYDWCLGFKQVRHVLLQHYIIGRETCVWFKDFRRFLCAYVYDLCLEVGWKEFVFGCHINGWMDVVFLGKLFGFGLLPRRQ